MEVLINKRRMTPKQQLAFEGFIDVMVQIYKMTADKIDYSKLVKNKERVEGTEAEKTVN